MAQIWASLGTPWNGFKFVPYGLDSEKVWKLELATHRTNQISNNNISVANNAASTLAVYLSFTAGDFLSINSSGAGQQFAWVTVAEIPA
jgi:hypothetical protein